MKNEVDDPYLWFDGPLGYDTPKEFIPLLDIVRRASDWRNLGLKVECDPLGNYKGIKKNGLWFSFIVVVQPDENHLASVKTGKKFITDARAICHYLKFGCTFDDFVSVGEDVRAYCEAQKLFEESKYDESLRHIKGALEKRPEDHHYREFWWEIRTASGDISAIDEQIGFYLNDMDTMVHCGKTDEWLRTLIDKREYAKASDLIRTILSSLDDLAEGKRKRQIYGGMRNLEFEKQDTLLKKTQFAKRLDRITGLSSAKKIVESHLCSEDFLELINLVISAHDPKKPAFVERIADSLVKWKKPELGEKYYRMALDLFVATHETKKKERVEKKLSKLS